MKIIEGRWMRSYCAVLHNRIHYLFPDRVNNGLVFFRSRHKGHETTQPWGNAGKSTWQGLLLLSKIWSWSRLHSKEWAPIWGQDRLCNWWGDGVRSRPWSFVGKKRSDEGIFCSGIVHEDQQKGSNQSLDMIFLSARLVVFTVLKCIHT